jgi:capsular polysaccharide biosynthesis protein
MTTEERESELEPREYLERALVFLRRAWAFRGPALVVMLVSELACLGFLLLRTPRYRSQTVLLYNERIQLAETGEAAQPPKSLAVRMQEMLTARKLLADVVTEFDLYPDLRKSYGMADAVEELKKHIEFHSPGGDTFTIAFVGETSEQARAVTSRLGQAVIDQDAELRRKQTVTTRDFLAGEKQRAAKRLRDAEQELASFMAEHPSFALDAMPLSTGVAIRATVGEGKSASSAGKSATKPRVIRWPAAVAKQTEPTRTTPPSAKELEARRDAEAESARAQAALAAARENLTDKRSRYTDAHPDVRAAREAVRRAESRAEQALLAVPKPAAAPRVEARAESTPAAPRYITLPPAKRSSEAAPAAPNAEDLVTLETDWARLTRQVTEARQRHDQVEVGLFKADLASSSATEQQGAQVTVIDPAFVPPRQVPPGPRMIAVLFTFGALVLGIGSALVAALFDDRVHDARSVSDLCEVLTEVPKVKRPRRAHA